MIRLMIRQLKDLHQQQTPQLVEPSLTGHNLILPHFLPPTEVTFSQIFLVTKAKLLLPMKFRCAEL